MKIELLNLGKRYNEEWIFKNLTYTFSENKKYAITGPNGSGKSTLLQVICGAATFQAGKLNCELDGKILENEKLFSHISFAAPYLELIEEMTLEEFLQFHGRMKGWRDQVNIIEIIGAAGLAKALTKQIRNFSSGMKQRVKLVQAIFSNSSAILLDEPATNLDEDGVQFYQELVNLHCRNELLLVASNDAGEYNFCDEIVDITRFK